MSFFGGGKKQVIKNDIAAPSLERAGKRGAQITYTAADNLNNRYNATPAEDQAREQIGIENRLLRNAADGAARRTQSLIAQRGMQNSSVGLGAMTNVNHDLANKVAMNNASVNTRTLDLLRNRISDGNNILAGRTAAGGGVQMRDISMRGKNGFGQLMDTAQGMANIFATVKMGTQGQRAPEQARSGYGGDKPANDYDDHYMNKMK